MAGEGGIAKSALAHDGDLVEDYPARPWLLAGLGGVAGLIVHLLLDVDGEEAWRYALASFTFFGFAAASFVIGSRRWIEVTVFALGLGAVMGGLAYLAVDAGDGVAGEEFAFAAGVFFSLLAVPLFQADFHRRRWATPYEETHFHVWTDALTAGGALLFVALSWLLLWLLHALFSLIGIEIIEGMIETTGFVGLFMGATYGAAMGVLRNQLGIIGTLQGVVMLVFSLLAVPFALAILIFLFALLASGGSALWEATDDATPVLLSCALGCFVLANAVVRDSDEARSSNVAMQVAAIWLSAAIFPLTVFAAISMGIRIDQYGFSPERLWALVATAIATAYGLAYWAGLARGRLAGWSHYLRRANLHLAVASCVIALLLALPLVNFGGISARQQVARLDAGEVSAEEFDYAALRWDFGDAGREVLASLAEREGQVGEKAQAALDEQSPADRYREIGSEEHRRANMQVEARDAYWEGRIREHFARLGWHCDEPCFAIDLGFDQDGERRVKLIEGAQVTDWFLERENDTEPFEPDIVLPRRTAGPLREDSTVEVREWQGRQIYVDGQPMGDPFPAEE